MPDPAPPAPGGLPCPQCGFNNAVNSVYCQDCGAKLPVAPPSYLQPSAPEAPPSGPPAKDAPSQAKKPRILRMDRSRGAASAFLGVTIRTLIYAAIFAGIIQLFRAPRDVPPSAAPLAAAAIEQARARFVDSAQRGIPVDAPWPRANAYLAGVLAPAEGGGPASFARAVVSYRPEGFALVTEKRLAGRVPIYTSIDYSVVPRSSGLSLVPTGGAIGRLPVPGWLAGVLPFIGGDLRSALQFELDLLAGARGVQFSPASARVDFAPAQP